MMKHIAALILIAMILAGDAPAQKRKPTRTKKAAPKKAAPEEKPAAPPMLGAGVVVVTRNGDQITGALVELTAYSVKIKVDNLESAVSLDTVSTISFGGATPPKGQPPGGHPAAGFGRDTETILAAFQSLGASKYS